MSRRLPAELGEVIGGYRLDELLSRGGMGSVYKATHAVLGRQACVKVLERSLAMDDEYVGRFLKEAKIVNDVRHENIVDIFDFVQSKNPRRIACIMEYIHGRTLKSVLAQGALTPVQSANAMLQLIDALKAVHAKGVIHRDLKPSNIMVIAPLKSDFSVKPAVKVLDFGIAKVEDSSSTNTGPGAMLGTPAYMAPEQISGDRITPATDVYALGEILFEMLTARRIFPGSNANDIIKIKLLGEAPMMRLPPHVAEPGLVGALLERCLSTHTGLRPTLQQLEESLIEIREKNQQAQAPERVSSQKSAPVESVDDTKRVPPPKGVVRKLGEYHCFAELPARGMTQNFVARKEGHVEICVLKRLLQHLEGNSTATARFTREARIAQYLSHPRLAKLFEASIEEKTLVIASEFIIGQPLDLVLDRLVDSEQRMPLQEWLPLALGVLDGLAYAHSAKDPGGRPLGIVHRDLTPNAIILAFSGDVKVRDFGIARAEVDDFKTAPGMAVGSIEYMSPEQARSAPIDHRSDLYTFSTVLYEALAGRPVVRMGNTLLDTLKSVTGDKPPPLGEARPDLAGSELAVVIERGLEKDPAKRWQSAAEYRDALRVALGKFADSSLDVVGDFLRALMPEEEQKAVELLGRIRELGEQMAAPRKMEEPPHEPTMTVRRRNLDPSEAPEEQEPSVMTMPGAPAPLDRASSVQVIRAPLARPPSVVPPKQSRLPLYLGATAIASVVVVLAAFLAQQPPKGPGQPVEIVAEPAAIARAPNISPKEAPVEEKTQTAEATTLEPAAVEELKPKKIVPKRAHSPVKAAPKPDPEPPPPPPPPPVRATPFAGIRGQLAQLRTNPKDVKLFDQVLASIASASRDLGPDGRRRVKVDLDAAERTYDVELLSSALDKLAIETAKAK